MPSPIFDDQRTFSVAENFVGRGLFEVDMPEQFGPRNWGQSSARTFTTGQIEAARPRANTRRQAEERNGMNM
jgi:hypothetical protein